MVTLIFIISLLFLTLDLVCSFSSSLWYKIRLFESFLLYTYAFIAINSLNCFCCMYKFWYVVFPFLSQDFNFPLHFFFDLLVVRSMLFNFHIFVNFLIIFLFKIVIAISFFNKASSLTILELFYDVFLQKLKPIVELWSQTESPILSRGWLIILSFSLR